MSCSANPRLALGDNMSKTTAIGTSTIDQTALKRICNFVCVTQIAAREKGLEVPGRVSTSRGLNSSYSGERSMTNMLG